MNRSMSMHIQYSQIVKGQSLCAMGIEKLNLDMEFPTALIAQFRYSRYQ